MEEDESMKIKVSRLRKLIREALMEDMSSDPTEYPPASTRPTERAPDMPTVPAPRSKDEKDLEKHLGGRKWGAPPQSQTKMKTPVEQKTLQVMNVLHQSPHWGDMSSEERGQLHDRVASQLKTMDPGELMVATAQDLAKQFTN